tara:strand:+ start:2607 stop:2948 length:342 start_codon:yes stop_codon:yes gene_type:complete
MKHKLIISESQYNRLNNFLFENTRYSAMVTTITDDLNKNYNKVIETYRENQEYKQRAGFEIMVDGQVISPKNLLEYFKKKYAVGEGFLKQLLEDWCDNKIKDGFLSKNIGLME